MANKKERDFKRRFKYDENNTDYDFQLKRRPNLWWLLLLLLPFVLFIPLKKDIKVVTQTDGCVETFVDVSMNYTARYLFWDKHFLAKVSYDTIQQTDSAGMTVFKNLGYSVYSYLFHHKAPVVFNAGNDCYEKVMENRRFHSVRKVTLNMCPKMADVRLKIVDAELRFELPGAVVESGYEGKTSKVHSVDSTDASGCVIVRNVRLCGGIDSIRVSADGYADTLLRNLFMAELLNEPGGYIIPLRPLKDRFTFFVKNKFKKEEPIPDALAEVILTLNGKAGMVDKSRTNVDGMGQGHFDNARVLATVDIKATKNPHYKPGRFESPTGKDLTVRDFIRLEDSARVVWLEPEPYTVQFRNVDTISGKPISGVCNEIVIDGIDGITRKDIQTSNRNGYFPVTAMAGDKITIVSTLDPYYHPKTTIIDSYEKEEIVYMNPVLVTLDFRTVEDDLSRILRVLPDCELEVIVDGEMVAPNNSGKGQFCVPNLRLTSKISIVASKTGYETNDTKVRNRSVEQLWNASQDERDIPLLKHVTLIFRTVEMVDGDITGLLPDCDLVISVDGYRINPVNSGAGEFVIEDLKPASTISIVVSKEYYDSNDTKVRNRNVGDLAKAAQSERDIPLGIHCVCGVKYKSDMETGIIRVTHLHVMGKSSGRFKFIFETLPWPDEIEIWNCRPDDIGRGGRRLWEWTLTDGVNHDGKSGAAGDGAPSEVWLDYYDGPYISVVSTRSDQNSYYNYMVCCVGEDCDWPLN